MNKVVLYAVVFPAFVTVLLTVAFVMFVDSNDVVPNTFNSTTWREFSGRITHELQATSTVSRVGVLLLVHSLHVYVCMPMCHITKIMYGYWLGLAAGWTLCCTWELLLFFVYLYLLRRAPQEPILGYMSRARAAGHLYRELVVVSMSSFPLQVCASTVQFGGVSTAEFMTANAVVTFVMSFKNVICGHFMSHSLDPQQVAMLSALVVFSTILPTLCTVYVSTQTIFTVLRPQPESARVSEPAAEGLLTLALAEPTDCALVDAETTGLVASRPSVELEHAPPHPGPMCRLCAWWRAVLWTPQRGPFRGANSPRYYALGPVASRLCI